MAKVKIEFLKNRTEQYQKGDVLEVDERIYKHLVSSDPMSVKIADEKAKALPSSHFHDRFEKQKQEKVEKLKKIAEQKEKAREEDLN